VPSSFARYDKKWNSPFYGKSFNLRMMTWRVEAKKLRLTPSLTETRFSSIFDPISQQQLKTETHSTFANYLFPARKENEAQYLAQQQSIIRNNGKYFVHCPPQIELPGIEVSEFYLNVTHVSFSKSSTLVH